MVDKFSHSYMFQKRGTYYFTKQVPIDVRAHYKRPRVVLCLNTNHYQQAFKASRVILQRLEDYWYSLRLQANLIPAAHLLVAGGKVLSNEGPTIQEALGIYIKLKGKDKNITFFRAAERNVGYVTNLLGNRYIGDYKSSDAATFRDSLFDRGLASSSVKRVFATLRSIFNITIQEHGLDINNAFSKTYIPAMDDITARKPVPISDIKRLQALCLNQPDDIRLILVLISDTGMRLSEAVGLVKEDMHLDGKHPYISLRPHPWRTLKTADSARRIPLVGASLTAALVLSDRGKFLFPSYNKTDTSNANSASAALNKWMKSRVPEGCVVHSFRHSLRDRLRAVECPADIIDAIGGWRTAGVGEAYGEGYPISVLHKWMVKLMIK